MIKRIFAVTMIPLLCSFSLFGYTGNCYIETGKQKAVKVLDKRDDGFYNVIWQGEKKISKEWIFDNLVQDGYYRKIPCSDVGL